MSSAQILVLGGVAGSTIFLGLPVGRMQSVSPRVKSFLSAAATGILLFLIWDVLSAAVDPVESALKSGRDARFFGLAALLAVGFGFGLHNATEGFGIVAPLAGDKDPPSWRFLGLLGLIGGGPTFVGTLVGQTWVSEALSVMFLALAAGSILYVVVELIAICRRFASKELVLTGILVGLVLGFATDFVLVAAGA